MLAVSPGAICCAHHTLGGRQSPQCFLNVSGDNDPECLAQGLHGAEGQGFVLPEGAAVMSWQFFFTQ